MSDRPRPAKPYPLDLYLLPDASLLSNHPPERFCLLSDFSPICASTRNINIYIKKCKALIRVWITF